MPSKQSTIFTTPRVQDAFQLRDLLHDHGIDAYVTNDRSAILSADRPETHRPTIRVLVAPDDVRDAEQVAIEFQRHGTPARGETKPLLTAGWQLEEWPVCPTCQAPRSTRCPFCPTAGCDFPLADPEFLGDLALADDEDGAMSGDASVASGGCCGGRASCKTTDDCGELPTGDRANTIANDRPDEADDRVGATTAPLVLMCPTCDEPFRPVFAAACEWCGHAFGDGFPVGTPASEDVEPVNPRMLVTTAALVAVFVAAVAYFLFIGAG